MLEPTTSVILAIVLMVAFGILIPILDSKPSLRPYVSYRWACIVFMMALTMAVVVDFEQLSDTARQYIILISLISIAVFVVARTIEKVSRNGFDRDIILKYGDAEASIIKAKNAAQKGNESAENSDDEKEKQGTDCDTSDDAESEKKKSKEKKKKQKIKNNKKKKQKKNKKERVDVDKDCEANEIQHIADNDERD